MILVTQKIQNLEIANFRGTPPAGLVTGFGQAVPSAVISSPSGVNFVKTVRTLSA